MSEAAEVIAGMEDEEATYELQRLRRDATVTLIVNGVNAMDIAERATDAVASFFQCSKSQVIIEDFTAEAFRISDDNLVAIWTTTIIGTMG